MSLTEDERRTKDFGRLTDQQNPEGVAVLKYSSSIEFRPPAL